uniref:Putative secreted protein n=1 Tax=Anopheles marajoara TaxID=58244 RepID=A0A2M4CFF0_9DIPT
MLLLAAASSSILSVRSKQLNCVSSQIYRLYTHTDTHIFLFLRTEWFNHESKSTDRFTKHIRHEKHVSR